MVTSVALSVLSRISAPHFLAHVRETGDYMVERLSEVNSPHIKQVRGRGLMVGVELDTDAQPVLNKGYNRGLLLIKARERVVRFVPPLILEKKHVDELVDKFGKILAEL